MPSHSARAPAASSDVRLERRSLVLRRWAELLVAAAVAAAACLLLASWRREELGRLLGARYWIFIAVGVCSIGLTARAAQGRWLAQAGLRHLLTYPPLYVGGIGGAGALCLVVGVFRAVRESMGLPAELSTALIWVGSVGLGIVTALLAASLAWSTFDSRTRQSSSTQEDGIEESEKTSAAQKLHGSFERMTAWLADDRPIEREDDDAFGHQRIARRIAARLMDDRPPAQAVVGRLGSGKTTLRALVVAALQDGGAQARHVQVVPVELWPYETSRAAVEGVIRALVEALACEVNVLALRGLPESYVAAMSSAGGIWSAVVHLQGAPASPFEALQRIDAVATAIGRRYVVWVEDLERFAGNGVAGGEESLEDTERLNPIRALLYGLDRLQSVTVVTATTSLHVRFDLEKIARYVEELPDLPEHDVAKIIATFRDGCRTRYGVIDPADPSIRKELDNLGDHQRLEIRRAILGTGIHSLQDALPALCSTPRALKQALRGALEAWNRLTGEIDIDDLLCISIVRETQPDFFAALRQHIGVLRGAGVSRDDRARAKQGWDSAFDKIPLDDRTRRAVAEVVKFVFSEYGEESKPQGVLNSRHTDYWERILAVPDLSKSERDQEVLKVLLADDDEAILRLLEDGQRSNAVESFARLLSTDRLRGLLIPLMERRSAENPGGWPEGDPPGMIPLWRMWLRRSERGELSPDAAFSEICRALDVVVPRSLYLAVRVEQYFVIPGGQVHDLLRDGDHSRAEEGKKLLRDLVVARYRGKPEALVEGLVGAHLPTLLWVCWGLDRVRAGDMTGQPFPSWPELAQTILEAARLHPMEVLPQVACLVAKEAMTFQRGDLTTTHDFDPVTAANLFGSADAVLDVFAPHDATQWAGVRPVEAVFTAVRARQQERT